MKINDIGEKEMERPSITEREISKIKELSAAPLESADSELAKEKLSEAKDAMADRLAQRKEARPMDTDTPAEAQKQLEQRRLSDQKDLEGIGTSAESTDVKKDTDADDTARPKDVSFKGSSCGGGHGCSGSTWCYGSGDFR